MQIRVINNRGGQAVHLIYNSDASVLFPIISQGP